MGQVLHAIRVFFEQLAAVDVAPLLAAMAVHVAKTFCTSRAWRNALAASYPGVEVRQRSIYGAYVAGRSAFTPTPATYAP